MSLAIQIEEVVAEWGPPLNTASLDHPDQVRNHEQRIQRLEENERISNDATTSAASAIAIASNMKDGYCLGCGQPWISDSTHQHCVQNMPKSAMPGYVVDPTTAALETQADRAQRLSARVEYYQRQFDGAIAQRDEARVERDAAMAHVRHDFGQAVARAVARPVARPHINKDGAFQSDKYPTCPPGKVPLAVKDKTAQDLLWEYAQRRREVDAEFADDLEFALKQEGYQTTPQTRPQHDPGAHIPMREGIELLRKMRDIHAKLVMAAACAGESDLHNVHADKRDELTVVARNLREAFEWLWPLLWTNDHEFVPVVPLSMIP